MNRFFFFLLISAFIAGCSKTEDDIIWQSSYGQGTALGIETTGDSGFVSVGKMDDKLYLLYLDNNKNKVVEYKSDLAGTFTGVTAGDGYFITAGSSGGKMILSKIDLHGTVLWDTLFNASFTVEQACLCRLNGDNYVAVGSASPDSAIKQSSRLLFVWFNGSGTITSRKDNVYSTFAVASSVAADNSGNLYLAVSKLGSGGYLKALTAKYDALQQQIVWEREIYNNPSFGSASLAITLDGSGNPVITGRTGMQVSGGTETNAFIARYFRTNDSLTKNYLEYSNAGTSVVPAGTGQFYSLNMKCLIINIIDTDMEISGIIRTFSSCDSKTTDIFGYSMDISSDGNLILGGSAGGSYYLAIKSSSALSPV